MIRRLLKEWHLPMFGVTDTNGKTINIKLTFSPEPKIAWVICKLAFLGLHIYAIVHSISIQEPEAGIWFAFLTHWGTIVCSFYFVSSFLSLVKFPTGGNGDGEGVASIPNSAKICWGLFTTSINIELFITVLYWVLEYKGGTPRFRTVYEHGIQIAVVCFDGLIIHGFPIRFKQIAWVYSVLIAFLLWTIIHAQTNIGNPSSNDNDPETDDDALYDSLSWNQRPAGATILAASLIFVGVPFFLLVTWLFSLLFPHKYSETKPDQESTEDKDGFDM